MNLLYYLNNRQYRYADGSVLGIFTGNFDSIEKVFFPDYILFPNGQIYDIYNKRYMTPYVSDKGYLKVTLVNRYPDHVTEVGCFVHRLVALNFIERTADDYANGRNQVNHISGVKSDCTVENLEWCNCRENIHHAITHGLHINPDYSGIKEQVLNDFRNGMTLAQACEKYHSYGISKSTLHNYKKEAIGLYDVYDYAREKEFVANALRAGIIPQQIHRELIKNGFNVSESWVFKLCRDLGYVANRVDFSEHYDEVEKMILEGIDPKIIAEKFGIKQNTVRKFANRRLGISYKQDNSVIKAEIKEKLANGASVSEIMKEYNGMVGESTVATWKREIFGTKTDYLLPKEIKEELIKDIQSGVGKPELYAKYSDKMSPRTIRTYYNKYCV